MKEIFFCMETAAGTPKTVTYQVKDDTYDYLISLCEDESQVPCKTITEFQ